MSGTRTPVLLVGTPETVARHQTDLPAYGYMVETADSAESALDLLDRYAPAILVSEFSLPGMTAPQMVNHLHMNRATRPLPTIALTGSESEIAEALAAGIDSCVDPQAGTAELAARINALLRDANITTSTILRERFRRPTVAIAAVPGGLLAQWSRKTIPQPGLSLLDLLHAEGVDAFLLDSTAFGTSDFWLPGVDCVMIDLSGKPDFDGLALCRTLDRQRRTAFAASQAPTRLLAFGQADCLPAADVYAAGADDFVTDSITSDMLLLHVRVLLRRKAMLDERLRSEAERATRDAAMESARAKTVLADALEQANDELASANRKLIDAQTKLVQSAKMASLGELVAGIAHEFNNPLAFVLAHEDTVSRLLDKAVSALDEGDGLKARALLARGGERLAASSLGLGRMRDLVSSLRRFSRLDQGTFENVNMPDAIGTVLALLGPKLTDRIRIELDFQAPPILHCQMVLVHQVVMNIISNAADALSSLPEDNPRPPGIRIATRLDPAVPVAAIGKTYVITICDNGPGIPPLMRERVFEPFFTTKPVGEGTGLGLATAYGIVQAHHGSIEVMPSPEGGACFTIAVPFNDGHERTVPARPHDRPYDRPREGDPT